MFVSSLRIKITHKQKIKAMVRKILWGVGLTVVGAFIGVYLHDMWKEHKTKTAAAAAAKP
jgi:hypothetical protein